MSKSKQTIEEIEDDAASNVKLKCIKAYRGTWDYGYGRIGGYSYKVGDVIERSKIFLKPKHWEVA